MKRVILFLIFCVLLSANEGYAQIQEILKQQDTTVTVLSKKEQKRLKKELEQKHEQTKEKKDNFITRTWYKIFPKKVERDISYNLMYKEKPKTIMVMYPWNRSKNANADEMFYVSICKELVDKGYYVLPALSTLTDYKADTLFNSRYSKQSDAKQFCSSHGVDAVLYVTIFTVKKEWWTTNVNMNAKYDLVSTKSGEVLFSRHADFNYDSQMPPKSKSSDGFIDDEKENHFLGISEKMQHYSFSDLPIGPYHKDYLLDQKRFSHKKEMKYKVNVKPS
ncbi:MAG: DUF799 family lipoprotein [Bacteroidales bacterium]|nr:DUF799 family lipoprotein [Bacteroidales bacterium]